MISSKTIYTEAELDAGRKLLASQIDFVLGVLGRVKRL